MKRRLLGVVLSCLVLLVASISWAAPPNWTTFSAASGMSLLGNITINGTPVARNDNNILGVFAPGVANPVGLTPPVGLPWQFATGIYSVIVSSNEGGVSNKNGANLNDPLSFQFYWAEKDTILTAYTVQNFGGPDLAITEPPDAVLFTGDTFFSEDNVTLNFTYDAPPAWTEVPSGGTVAEGLVLTGAIQATDPNGDAVTYGVTNLPGFCTFGTTSGAIACAPGFADAGTYSNICFSASSGSPAQYATPNPACVTVVVTDNNRAPVLNVNAPIDNLILYAGVTLTREFTASDLDNQALTWSLSADAPPFCALSGAGNIRTLSCTPALSDQGGSGTFRVTVSDGIDNTSLAAAGSVVNRKPVIAAVPSPQNISYAKATPSTIPLDISDADGNAITASNATISPAAAWFAYDPGTRTITVTPPLTLADVGNYTVAISAIDNGTPPLAADNVVFGLNIVNQVTWDNAFQATSTVPEGGTIVFNAKATDPFGKPITYANSTGLPSFCTLNPATRILTCSPGFADNGVYVISFTASAGGFDALPNPMTTTLTVTNTNRAPVLNVNTPIDNLVLYAGVTTTRTFTASDADNQALTWSTLDLPPFSSFTGSGNSRTLTFTPAVTDQGSGGSFSVTVSDGTDNTTLAGLGNVVNRKPAIGAVAAQTVSYLKASATTIPVTISDPDGNAVTFAASISPVPATGGWYAFDNAARTVTVNGPVPIGDVGAYTVTLAAVDNGTPPLAADNVAFTLNIVQQISWDNTVPATVSVNEGETTTFPVKASDPLGGTVVYSVAGLPSFCADNATTGIVTCSPGFRNAGSYTITSRATASGYWATPDNVVTTLTVVNHSVPSFNTVIPAGDISGVVGAGAATFTKSFTVADADPTETISWTTQNLPSFCTLTGADNTLARSVSCTPTLPSQQGTYSDVSVTVSDGFDNATRTFVVTVDNRAPVISVAPLTYVNNDNTSASTIPVTLTDPDGNGIATSSATLSPSRGWFAYDSGTRTITLTGPIDPADVGIYTITIDATDDGTPAQAASPAATATLRVVYPRRYAEPAVPTGAPTMTLSGTFKTPADVAAPFSDEVAVFSVHRKPGSPVRWEKTLVGAGRFEGTTGGLSMTVIGDNPATDNIVEGCRTGDDLLLVYRSNADGKEYYAFDNGAGGPLALVWGAGAPEAVTPRFIEGNRYPLRTGGWNLFGYGTLHGYRTDLAGGLSGGLTAVPGHIDEYVANVGESFPLKSIEGKYDRILGNSGSGMKSFQPSLPQFATLDNVAPGYGYFIKVKPSARELVWVTVPGPAATSAATFANVPAGYALLSFFDEGSRYRMTGYDDSAELTSLRTLATETASTDAGASIGAVWGAIAGKFDRLVMYDAAGAKLFVPALPAQFNTMKYIAPGYGYWIKVTDPAGTPVSVGLP
jgi:hypothetical protein